jgi:hypothetical protein
LFLLDPVSSTEPPAQPSIQALADLRGLRTAPELSEPQRLLLRSELTQAMELCPWFTIGVMAPSAAIALAALRRWEGALGWDPLEALDASADGLENPVFLKGNQRTGTYLLREEAGLGEGILISGQNPEQPDLAETWGPFPLDLLA